MCRSLEVVIHLRFINRSKTKKYKKIIKLLFNKIMLSLKLKVHLLIKFNVAKLQEVLTELRNFQAD